MSDVPNYLPQAIVTTILCCLPFGIPAIIFAAQVNGRLIVGDYEGAVESSRKAKMWCWVAFGVGMCYILFMFSIQLIPLLIQLCR